MNSSQESLPIPPPPGVVGALKAGLDVISTHISIILLPLALDAFLWLGPRLSVKSIFTAFYTQMLDIYKVSGMPVDELTRAEPQWIDFLQQFNLFGFLRTFPVGVSSLMQAKMPILSPFGSQNVIEVGSWLSLFGWMFLLTLLGWTLGAIYFQLVSRLVSGPERVIASARAIGQSMLFSIGFVIVALVIGMPVLFVLSILNLFGAAVMQTGLFVIMLFASWLVVPLFFTPHGIFMRGENAFHSVLTSLRMSRFILPSASMFVLALFLAAQGLNILWTVPPDESWMLLVGIAGHAFVTTALLAASFIYYRDMNAWLNIVAERLKTSAPRQAL
jgi:hypothetical protein